jgi:predicted nucleotidyltransferase
MRVGDDRQICGVSAVSLRRLFQRGRFSTPHLMRAADQGEPDVTDTLILLEHEGWITWAGREALVDWWTPTDEGHRLTATRLIKRFPRSVGQGIAQDVVERARELNRNPLRSMRVTALYLFGSVLTGSEDDTVGDVDVVCETAYRRLGKEQLDELKERELRQFPKADFLARFAIPDRILKRELRIVSKKLALHQRADLDLPGLRYRQIYAFDIEREVEVPFDPIERVGAGILEEEDRRSSKPTQPFPERKMRAWPAYPPELSYVSMEGESGRAAEHLWQNGASTEEIAVEVHRDQQMVLSYLASRSDRVASKPSFDSALDRVVCVASPADRDFEVAVMVDIGRQGSSAVEVMLYEPGSEARLGRGVVSSKNDIYIHQTRSDLVPVVERLVRAAEQWRKRMYAPTGRLRLRAFAALLPGDAPEPVGQGALSFKPLESPLRKALDQLWDRGRWDAEEIELVLELSRRPPRVQLLEGWGTSASPRKVPKELSAPILAALKPIVEKWGGEMFRRASYTVGYRGTRLLEAANDI